MHRILMLVLDRWDASLKSCAGKPSCDISVS